MHRLITCVVSLLVIGLFATACGGSDGSTVDSTTSSEASETADAADAAEATSDASADDGETEPDAATEADADGAADEADGAADEAAAALAASVADEDDPIGALLGFDGFEDPQFLVEQQRLVDERIQACMIQQGFDYTPQNIDADDLRFGRSIAPGLSDEEFAATHGFGITEGVYSLLNLVNSSVDDPNTAMLADMSEGEAEAWQAAMMGGVFDTDPETGEMTDPETGESVDFMQLMMSGDGCAMVANREVFSSFQALFQLETEFADLDERIHGDRRFIEIETDWAACMSEAGFDYTTYGEPETDIDEQVQVLITPLLASAGGGAPGADIDREPIELTADQQARVDELFADEVRVAVANHECIAADRDEVDEITRRYQLEFIEQNASTLAGLTS